MTFKEFMEALDQLMKHYPEFREKPVEVSYNKTLLEVDHIAVITDPDDIMKQLPILILEDDCEV